MTRLWFKAKRFGWGWTPITVEGWAVILLFVLLVLASVLVVVHRVRGGADPRGAWLLFALWIALLVAALIAIGYAKGEPPRWRWGP